MTTDEDQNLIMSIVQQRATRSLSDKTNSSSPSHSSSGRLEAENRKAQFVRYLQEEGSSSSNGGNIQDVSESSELDIAKLVETRLRVAEEGIQAEREAAICSGGKADDVAKKAEMSLVARAQEEEMQAKNPTVFRTMAGQPGAVSISPSSSTYREAVLPPTVPPAPPPLTRTAVRNTPEIGAIAVGGTENSSSNGISIPIPSNSDHELDYSDDGLAVAKMVKEPGLLPQAEDFQADSASKTEQQRRQWKWYVLLAVILLLVIPSVVVLAIVVPRNEEAATDIEPQEISLAPSDTPSQAPTSHQDYMLSLFPEQTISLIEEHPESAQARAFEWLLEDTDHNPSLSIARTKQRFYLTTLFFATRGEDWLSRTNWTSHDVHECSWENKPVFAHQESLSRAYPGYLKGYVPSARCDETGMYLNLWLDGNNLQGSIPDELYLMSSLETLSLGFNQKLEGTISSHIGRLTDLGGFFIAFVETTGPIPTEIGLLKNLWLLTLFKNSHHGTIPMEIWQLPNLETFIIGDNDLLVGTLPTEVGLSTKLRWLTLGQSGLTGTIPTEIGLLTSLEWAAWFNCGFNGILPTEMGLLSSISNLNIVGNYLSGPLPSQMGALTTITNINLGQNLLAGTIPSEFGLLTSLTVWINLQGNSISGTIPTELGLLTQLQDLSLQGNQITGPIPSELGLLAKLSSLGLANNSLVGTVPQGLSVLQQTLYSLELEDNLALSGTIPSALCSIDGTCNSYGMQNPCESPFKGLSFNCTNLLCGCGCSCVGE